ncbi:MAG: hypothetical protein LUD17_12645 [Bacteroidales bacterium]|nr:hypothetical protein [Bacteroidales bacterium]
MKKSILYGALIALSAAAVTACSDDDDDYTPVDPEQPTESVAGFYVLNQGNMGYQIEGDLSYGDYSTGAATQDLFQNANGRSLGNTPQTAIVYGNHMYIGVYESNTIEIVNPKTYAVEKQISLANESGQNPRSMVATEGKVYISMYNGYVCRLDTASLSIDATVKVGPNPEIMAISNRYLYVPNSDGMNWEVGYGTTASKIDLNNFQVVKTFEVGLNPSRFISNANGDLFVLCMGNYGDVAATVYKVRSDDSLVEVTEATNVAMDGNYLYMCNAPYGIDKVVYYRYDTTSDTLVGWEPSKDVDSIAGMAVDATDGYVLISSYSLDGGYASYSLPGYVNQYDLEGNFIRTYSAGVGPCWIFFK